MLVFPSPTRTVDVINENKDKTTCMLTIFSGNNLWSFPLTGGSERWNNAVRFDESIINFRREKNGCGKYRMVLVSCHCWISFTCCPLLILLQWIARVEVGQQCRPPPRVTQLCPHQMEVGDGLWFWHHSSPLVSHMRSPRPSRSSSRTSRLSSMHPTVRLHGSPPSCLQSCTLQVSHRLLYTFTCMWILLTIL